MPGLSRPAAFNCLDVFHPKNRPEPLPKALAESPRQGHVASCPAGGAVAPAHHKQVMCRIDRRRAALHPFRDAQFKKVRLEFRHELA
jgi:hypothetical protein